MREQKPTLSFRVRPELREAIKNAFYKEASPHVESAAALMEQLMEYAWLEYQKYGSIRKLLPLKKLEMIKKEIHRSQDARSLRTVQHRG